MRAEEIGMDFSRERALAYAHRWAFGRNPEYLAFDRLGGDCRSRSGAFSRAPTAKTACAA